MTDNNSSNVTTKEPIEDNRMAQRFRGFYPVIIDVETAGFNAQTDALLEFAAITTQFDDNGNLIPKNTYFYRIKPFEGSVIVKANIDFIGIDPFDPNRKAFEEREVFPSFFKSISKEVKAAKCKRAILVGHNANFDHGFIKAVVERIKYKRDPFHPFSVIDTASLAGIFYGQTVLGRAAITAGLDYKEENAHSALYDTQMEAELFCNMVNRYKDLGGWPLSDEMNKRAEEAVINYAKKTN